jgi:hypothetical protein
METQAWQNMEIQVLGKWKFKYGKMESQVWKVIKLLGLLTKMSSFVKGNNMI